MTAPIDLEALRGHTPGPWFIPSTMGSSGGVAHASGYVCFTAIPRKVDEARWPGESWLDMRNRTQQDRDAIAVEESTNARLIAAGPALLAELTTRRARDADVEALVAACRLARSYMSEAIEYETPGAKRDGAAVDAALLPFQRSDDKGDSPC